MLTILMVELKSQIRFFFQGVVVFGVCHVKANSLVGW